MSILHDAAVAGRDAEDRGLELPKPWIVDQDPFFCGLSGRRLLGLGASGPSWRVGVAFGLALEEALGRCTELLHLDVAGEARLAAGVPVEDDRVGQQLELVRAVLLAVGDAGVLGALARDGVSGHVVLGQLALGLFGPSGNPNMTRTPEVLRPSLGGIGLCLLVGVVRCDYCVGPDGVGAVTGDGVAGEDGRVLAAALEAVARDAQRNASLFPFVFPYAQLLVEEAPEVFACFLVGQDPAQGGLLALLACRGDDRLVVSVIIRPVQLEEVLDRIDGQLALGGVVERADVDVRLLLRAKELEEHLGELARRLGKEGPPWLLSEAGTLAGTFRVPILSANKASPLLRQLLPALQRRREVLHFPDNLRRDQGDADVALLRDVLRPALDDKYTAGGDAVHGHQRALARARLCELKVAEPDRAERLASDGPRVQHERDALAIGRDDRRAGEADAAANGAVIVFVDDLNRGRARAPGRHPRRAVDLALGVALALGYDGGAQGLSVLGVEDHGIGPGVADIGRGFRQNSLEGVPGQLNEEQLHLDRDPKASDRALLQERQDLIGWRFLGRLLRGGLLVGFAVARRTRALAGEAAGKQRKRH